MFAHEIKKQQTIESSQSMVSATAAVNRMKKKQIQKMKEGTTKTERYWGKLFHGNIPI